MTEGEFQKQLKKYHKTGEKPVELAVKLLSECAMDCVYEEETEEAKFMAIKALEQDPKTGHWIRWYEQKENDCVVDNIPHCKCSECGKEYDPHSSQFIKYCNECGAKMVEPQESESKRYMELAKSYLQGLRAGLEESEVEE